MKIPWKMFYGCPVKEQLKSLKLICDSIVKTYCKNKIPFFVIVPFCTPIYLPEYWFLKGQVYIEILRLQPYCFQLRSGTPVFWKNFPFFRKFVSKFKYWNWSKFPVIEELFWESLAPFYEIAFSRVKTKTNLLLFFL